MSEKLYNKYRFTELAEIVGKLPHVEKLKSDIASGNIDHTYLFYSDTQGTGKTSMARLMSQYIPDVYVEEINASVDNGASKGKEIARTAYSVPIGYRKKLLIINEPMRASGNFFDALLEVFEETGEDLYVIITTTEVRKIPPNIRSRFTDVKFTLPDMKSLRSHLSFICEKENINVDRKILTKICNKNNNIVRDAISDLELLKGVDSTEAQLKLLEVSGDTESSGYEIAKALYSNASWSQIKKMVKDLPDSDIEKARRTILNYHTKIFLEGAKEKASHSEEIIVEMMEPFFDSGKGGFAVTIKNCC